MRATATRAFVLTGGPAGEAARLESDGTRFRAMAGDCVLTVHAERPGENAFHLEPAQAVRLGKQLLKSAGVSIREGRTW